jgi:hypothetical protein
VYSITGVQDGGGSSYMLGMSLYNVGGPGTYPLGVGSTVPGGSVSMSSLQGAWATLLTGAEGTITISTLDATHMAGSFDFTANAVGGGATGSRTASNGEFLLGLQPGASIAPLPDSYGSRVRFTLAGNLWSAANAGGSYSPASRTVSIAASNNARMLLISLDDVTGPGTYSMGGGRHAMHVNGTTNVLSNSWSSAGSGSSGSVTITSLSATRMRGSFSATLGPAPGSNTVGAITLSEGTFDIGLPAPPL